MWSWSHTSNGWETRQPIDPITWRPQQLHLHYNELYMGIYEWLRAPPCLSRKNEALQYLASLRQSLQHMQFECEVRTLQQHRVQWTEEWLACLQQEDSMSDADTEDGIIIV